MMRIQTCVALALLLVVESESFSTTAGTARITTRSLLQQQQQQQHQQDTIASTRKRAFLHGSRFDIRNESYGGLDKVNNRHSASDYWYNIRTLPSSCILRDIGNPVLAVFGWSTVVSLAHFLMAKSGRSFLQSFASKLCISSAAHSFLVSSIGLLLVFRTNSAYQRFNVSTLPVPNVSLTCALPACEFFHSHYFSHCLSLITGRAQDLGTNPLRRSQSLSIDEPLRSRHWYQSSEENPQLDCGLSIPPPSSHSHWMSL
jgi:hypothetical protein